jgi:phosphoglycolate phosphatase-like HAD superfamily hydrolase
MIRAIFFDFDGVLIESAEIKTRAFRRLFAEYGDAVEEIVSYHVANMGISRFVKFRHIFDEILHLPLSVEQEDELGERFSGMVLQEVLEAPLVPGVLDFLETYKGRYLFFIVSGTPEQELRDIADRRRLSPFFLEIHGSPESKEAIIEGIISRYALDSDEALMIGDGETDLLAAEKNRITFVARITSENEDQLSKCRLKVRDLSELEGMVNRLSTDRGA